MDNRKKKQRVGKKQSESSAQETKSAPKKAPIFTLQEYLDDLRKTTVRFTVRHEFLIAKARYRMMLKLDSSDNQSYCAVLAEVIKFGLSFSPNANAPESLIYAPPTEELKKLLARDDLSAYDLNAKPKERRKPLWDGRLYYTVRYPVRHPVLIEKAVYRLEHGVVANMSQALTDVLQSFIDFYILYCPYADDPLR